MTVRKVRIAIFTDFHAYASRPDDKAAKPSWLDLNDDQANAKQNPFAALKHVIGLDDTMRADLVLCLGDLGDKASRDGQQYVWREVNAIKDLLGASEVLGTAGNHDLDSRHIYDDHDAKGQIQALEPPFPIANDRNWLEYWARNFTVIERSGVRFTFLNTAAYHGYANDAAKPEYVHGRVSDRTIDKLVADLSAGGARAANILVCHHHPFKNDRIKSSDYSEMKGGDRLINKLSDAKMGPWLVIHGHKHDGRLFHAPGSNSSPTIFSAASFSARPYPNQDGPTVNEFYLLDLDVPAKPGMVMSLTGSVRTWAFSFDVGWQRPPAGSGLGPRAGFGARLDTGALATDIAMFLRDDEAGQPVEWSAVAGRFPSVRHLVPEEFGILRDLLHEQHNVGVNLDYKTQEISVVQAR